MNLNIEPLVGVGPIRFGMTRAEVHAALGMPERIDDRRECFLGGFMVDFDASGLAEFIEMAESDKFTVTFQDKNLHAVPAEELVKSLSAVAKIKEDDVELGYSYIFPELQISLWRGTIPESAQDEDGRYFEAVGVARKGYFDS